MPVQKTHGPGSTEDAVKAIVQEVCVVYINIFSHIFTINSKGKNKNK